MRMDKSENADILEDERESSNPSASVSDWVKRAIGSGFGSVFLSEDGSRKGFSELKLPKEVVTSVLGQVDRAKKDLVHVVAREFRGFLDNLEISELVLKVLSGATFEINAQIRVKPSKSVKEKIVDSPREKAKTAGKKKPAKAKTTQKKKRA